MILHFSFIFSYTCKSHFFIMNNKASSSSSSESDEDTYAPPPLELTVARKLPKILQLPSTHQEALDFLFDNGILTRLHNITCPSCGRVGMRWKTPDKKVIRCPNNRCNHNGKKNSRFQQSIYHQTFFAGTKLSPRAILHISLLWLNRISVSVATSLYGYSSETVSDFYSYLRELTTLHYENLPLAQQWIGGPGEIVEIDESKFAKRKYNRGHKVGDKSWVFGGICRSNKEFFAVVVLDRKEETLLDYIKQYIAPGTMIFSDGWKAYHNIRRIEGFNYSHEVVNHSENFVDPVTGTHTNTIESKWGGLKRVIPKNARRKERLGPYLTSEMWRKKHINDLWGGLIQAWKSVVYEKE